MNTTIHKLVTGFVLCAAVFADTAVYAQEKTAVVNQDNRIPVMLRPSERTRVLGDMRQYLKGLQEMFSALAEDDMTRVAAAARTLGTINVYNARLMFPTRSAVTFRELSVMVHADFEGLAGDAEKLKDSRNGENTKGIMRRLSQTMLKCVACHDSYRLVDKAHSGSEEGELPR
ncbi:MAG: hypothetical protein A2Z95_03825 [Gallionellales bacterium GWA2_60_18]|nr:MAG: hypothetical protein A2Z95_03825 [Gallionellales bacterium GWA2_60_18]